MDVFAIGIFLRYLLYFVVAEFFVAQGNLDVFTLNKIECSSCCKVYLDQESILDQNSG